MGLFSYIPLMWIVEEGPWHMVDSCHPLIVCPETVSSIENQSREFILEHDLPVFIHFGTEISIKGLWRCDRLFYKCIRLWMIPASVVISIRCGPQSGWVRIGCTEAPAKEV